MEDKNSNFDRESVNVKKPKKGWWKSIRTDPIPTVGILMAVICALVTIVFAVAIVQVFTTGNVLEMKKREISLEMDRLRFEIENIRAEQKKEMEEVHVDLGKFVKEQKEIFLKKTAMLTYADYAKTIKRYITKLAGDDIGQQIVAIWVLLDILHEVKLEYPDLFSRVVPEYSGAIPCLKLDIHKEEFDDSYRGKVWIWVILLESRDEHIRSVFRTEIKEKPALTPELLDKIFEYNENKLSQENRSDLYISIERLKPLIRSLRAEI